MSHASTAWEKQEKKHCINTNHLKDTSFSMQVPRSMFPHC